MKAKEWKKLFENIDDETEIKLYVYDYEYSESEPYEIGNGTFIDLDESNYLNIGINK